MTSNVGAAALKRNKYVGFTVEDDVKREYTEMKDKVLEELKKAFRPEFLNRIDEITVFHSLQKEHIQEIIKLMAATLTKRLGEQGIEFELTESALEKIAEIGYDPEYGARHSVVRYNVKSKIASQKRCSAAPSQKAVKSHSTCKMAS